MTIYILSNGQQFTTLASAEYRAEQLRWGPNPADRPTVTTTTTYPYAECLITGHRGHYAHVDLIELALFHGMPDEADDNGITLSDVVDDYNATGGTGDYCEFTPELSDEAEEWLNANVATNDHAFGWVDGEFYFANDTWWDVNAE